MNRVGQATLNESNPLSYINDKGRSEERDYFKLQNREHKLQALNYLSNKEFDYILGNSESGARKSGDMKADTEAVKKALYGLHEQDLIEMRALVYLQRLPDTSPEYQQLRIMTGMNNREQIAQFIAEKQIRKLMMSQLEAITGGSKLTEVYKETIKKGPNTFLSLWA